MAKQTKPQELLDAVRELPEKLPIFPEPTPLVLKDETAALPADDGRIEYTVTATAPPGLPAGASNRAIRSVSPRRRRAASCSPFTSPRRAPPASPPSRLLP